MINGETKLIGVIGWPVTHSLSPIIHNAAFHALNLNYVYLPLPVRPEELADAIAGLKSLGFVGANVTIPHKISIMPLLDEIDASANRVGAVNTIVIKNQRAIGYNTDSEGFIQALTQGEEKTVVDKKAVVLGAGGAARAVVYGLLDYGISQITVAARSSTKASQFINTFHREPRLCSMGWHDSNLNAILQKCNYLINCTPLGMYPNVESEPPLEWQHLNQSAIVCDIVYNPRQTKFLTHANQCGFKMISGDGMLVEQGALAFKLWTGYDAPKGTMFTNIWKALKEM